MNLIWLFLLAAAIICIAGVAGVLHRLRHPPRKTYAVAVARDLPTDPGPLGYAFESVTFGASDDTHTPGWVIAGHAPAGPTVLVIHGFGDSRYGALHWVPLLVEHAKQVVLFDLPGHGESQRRTSSAGLLEYRDVSAVINQLDPDDRFVLFGYSLGAGIAIVAAAQDDRVAGVIADGPYRHWDEPLRAILRRKRYPTWPILPLAGLWLRLMHPEFRGFDRVAHAARLRCPLLVLHGHDDPLCPFEAARAIVEAAPLGRLVEFPNGCHLDLAACDEAQYRAGLRWLFDEVDQRREDGS